MRRSTTVNEVDIPFTWVTSRLRLSKPVIKSASRGGSRDEPVPEPDVDPVAFRLILIDPPFNFAVLRAYAYADVLDQRAFLRIADVTATISACTRCDFGRARLWGAVKLAMVLCQSLEALSKYSSRRSERRGRDCDVGTNKQRRSSITQRDSVFRDLHGQRGETKRCCCV